MRKIIPKLHKIIAVFLMVSPFLVNKWTLEFFLTEQVGQNLSNYMTVLLFLLTTSAFGLGIAILKFGPTLLKEIWVLLILILPIFVTKILIVSKVGGISDVSAFFYAGFCNLWICTILTLLFFRWGLLAGFFIICLISFVDFAYAAAHTTIIDPVVYFVLMETNLQETKGYFTTCLFNFQNLFIIGCFIVLCLFLFKITRNINRKRVYCYLLVLTFSITLPFAFLKCRQNVLHYNFIYKIIQGRQQYKLLYAETNKFNSLALDKIEQVTFSKPPGNNDIGVMIIGESADRDHMGVYGYYKNNTPNMQKISDDLFFFSDVISVHLNTIPNMTKMLTFEDFENNNIPFEKGNFIHLLKKAGYKTYWISNQFPTGKYDTMTTALAKTCDLVSFVNCSKNLTKSSYDEKILPVFQKIISQDHNRRKFIFIHLMGSHHPFQLRYPKEFDRFSEDVPGKTKTQSKIINYYDNSILYTDYIVTEIIEMTKNTNTSSCVLYISDHGLEVYDKTNHCGHSLEGGLEIPFILWFSDKYKTLNNDKIRNFNMYLERKYLSEDILFSICDLLNMKFDSFDPKRSIFSDFFKEKKRLIGLPSKKAVRDYDSTQYLLAKEEINVFRNQPKALREKVWAHRVNQIDKLTAASDIFYGVELDVLYNIDKNIFDIAHDEAQINYLSLDDYWASMFEPKKLKFWIDFKNISSENKTVSLKRLIYLSDKYMIPKENIIVESKKPLLLIDFKKNGFFTSYWISLDFLKDDFEKK